MTDMTTAARGSIVVDDRSPLSPTSTQAIRLFVFFEAASFIAAASVHFGVLISGYEHRAAGVAESVIAAVLIGGFAGTWMVPKSTRGVGLAVQGFALLGTLVGLLTIAIGVGPRTIPDIAYHVGIVAVLIWGLVVGRRARARPGLPTR